MNEELGEPFEPLELRGNGFLPSAAPDPALVERMTDPRITGEAWRTMELAGLSNNLTRCKRCDAVIPFTLEARVQSNGDEHWYAKPCPICEYSEVVTIVPKRAVQLRSRIDAIRAVGIGPRNQKRFNTLVKMYRRVMRHAEQARERAHDEGSE